MSPRVLGPFRLVSVGASMDPSRMIMGGMTLVTIAIPRGADGKVDPIITELYEAVSKTGRDSTAEGGVMGIGHYKQAAAR
jgi:hypothetical protein